MVIALMDCPNCGGELVEVTESWHTFAQATGAEYLASYVTIWHCRACGTVAGAGEEDVVEWVIQPEEALAED